MYVVGSIIVLWYVNDKVINYAWFWYGI